MLVLLPMNIVLAGLADVCVGVGVSCPISLFILRRAAIYRGNKCTDILGRVREQDCYRSH